MTADVKQLGWRDEVAKLIEGHFKIVWVFLPDHQAHGAGSRARAMFGCHVHQTLLSRLEKQPACGEHHSTAR
jgi:hypothetical protein